MRHFERGVSVNAHVCSVSSEIALSMDSVRMSTFQISMFLELLRSDDIVALPMTDELVRRRSTYLISRCAGETMELSESDIKKLVEYTKLIEYPYRDPFLHPSVVVHQDRVTVTGAIGTDMPLMACAPVLSYFRKTHDSSAGLLYSLIGARDEDVDGLYSRLSPLYPRTESERAECLARSYPDQNRDTLAVAASQTIHILMLFCRCNAFHATTGYRFLFLEGSKLNHSCKPNARWELGKRGELTVTSLRAILPGEEVTINYCPGLQECTGRERRNHLLRNLYFQCHSEMCRGRCNFCDKKQEKLAVCAKCKKVSYCSRDCQKGDWGEHKRLCLARLR